MLRHVSGVEQAASDAHLRNTELEETQGVLRQSLSARRAQLSALPIPFARALHPTLYTLHPTPYTLHPKPQTPNAKPGTAGAARSRPPAPAEGRARTGSAGLIRPLGARSAFSGRGAPLRRARPRFGPAPDAERGGGGGAARRARVGGRGAPGALNIAARRRARCRSLYAYYQVQGYLAHKKHSGTGVPRS